MAKGKKGKTVKNNDKKKNNKENEMNHKKSKRNPKEKNKDKKYYDNFNNSLRTEHNLMIFYVEGDGNCLFRSICHQLEGDDSNHAQYRQEIVKFIRENLDFFKLFIADDDADTIEEYVDLLEEDGELFSLWFFILEHFEKKEYHLNSFSSLSLDSFHHLTFFSFFLGTWGGNLELFAFSCVYNLDITIYQSDQPTYVISADDSNEMTNSNLVKRKIKLAFHGDCHYNSLVSLNSDDEENSLD